MASATGHPPLIITLNINEKAQAFFGEQRRLYFPKHINYLDAHLTFFHNLPSDDAMIKDSLIQFSGRPSFEMQVTGVRHLGNGVAYALHSPELQDMHLKMQTEFRNLISGKDKQKLWPHITVQNKVTANKADILYRSLNRTFTPLSVTATGLSSWLYLNGPWEKKDEFSFRT